MTTRGSVVSCSGRRGLTFQRCVVLDSKTTDRFLSGKDLPFSRKLQAWEVITSHNSLSVKDFYVQTHVATFCLWVCETSTQTTTVGCGPFSATAPSSRALSNSFAGDGSAGIEFESIPPLHCHHPVQVKVAPHQEGCSRLSNALPPSFPPRWHAAAGVNFWNRLPDHAFPCLKPLLPGSYHTFKLFSLLICFI